jgi:hypothetical protein
MSRDRAERVALTEAAFRIANERMAAWEEAPADEPALYFCECGLLECREKVSLTVAQYEQVRARPERFFVVPGHQIDDVEDVVAEEDGFLVIEKPEAVIELVRGADPRREDAGDGRAEAEQLAEGIDPS